MKKSILLCTTCALYLSFSSVINAAPVTFNFVQNGYDEGAFVTGVFSGEDLNNDGQLSSFFDEVTSFTMNFSGNSLVESFSQNFAELDELVYDLDGGPLGDGLLLDGEGILTFGTLYSYSSGQGPNFGNGGIIQSNTTFSLTFSSELIQITSSTAVPIPAAVWLFGSGLLGLIGAAKRKA